MLTARFAIELLGLLDGEPHCLAFTYRGSTLRAVSFRRTHWKEYRRHVR
jgi:uncharacterized DUF497 family protein